MDAGIRAQLLERFGMFGIRMSMPCWRAGKSTTAGLSNC